jgi:hypothetical protein
MVKKRLRNLVNVALLSSGGGGMLVRVALVCVCGLGAGILGTGWAAAEDLAPEQASAFVVGQLFSYTCFEGTAGIGRIFPDGSVVHGRQRFIRHQNFVEAPFFSATLTVPPGPLSPEIT